MIKVKTSELTGVALDWAAIEANGWGADYVRFGFSLGDGDSTYTPSTNWAQGGLIIERECIELTTTNRSNNELWEAIGRGFGEDCPAGYGPTPLIAAMRCYVASKLGDIVETPKELTKEITSC